MPEIKALWASYQQPVPRQRVAGPGRERTVNRRAYSYVEVLTVVMILAIMAAAAVPRYADSLVHMRLDAATRRIASDFAAAQARARMTSSRQTITFTVPPAGNSYQIVGMKDPDHANLTYTVNLADTSYQCTFNSVNLGGDASLVYDGYGTPDSGGTIVVRSGSYTKTVTHRPRTPATATAE